MQWSPLPIKFYSVYSAPLSYCLPKIQDFIEKDHYSFYINSTSLLVPDLVYLIHYITYAWAKNISINCCSCISSSVHILLVLIIGWIILTTSMYALVRCTSQQCTCICNDHQFGTHQIRHIGAWTKLVGGLRRGRGPVEYFSWWRS